VSLLRRPSAPARSRRRPAVLAVQAGLTLLAGALAVSAVAPAPANPGPATAAVVSSGTTGTSTSATTSTARAPRPNIVLITTDDQADTDLSAMPRTRRLLGGRGVEFVNAISPHPLCCPARAEIFTGEYAHNNGVQHNDGPLGGHSRFAAYRDGRNLRGNLGAWLRQAGYRTGFTGKMLNGYTARSPRPAGWDWWDPTTERTYAYTRTTFFDDGRPVTPKGYATDVLARRSSAWVREQAPAAKPFFLWVSHVAPHEAIVGGKPVGHPFSAARHEKLHRDARPPSMRKPSYNEADVSDKPRYSGIGEKVPDAEVLRTHRQRLRSLAAVDEANASILRTLERTGELGRTLVVFTSDNGFLLGEHRLRGKNQVYDENLQVPLLVRGPGVPSGETSTALAETVDLAPTILDAAGALERVRRSGRVDGRSLLDLFARGDRARQVSSTTLVQPGTKRRAALRGNDGWAFRGVTTARYTYAVHFTGQAELYDRQVDPHELENLLDLRSGRLRPAAQGYAEVLAALRSRLRDLRSCQGPAECDRRYPPLPDPR
jgi:N-acetylglucosamine-6-sulfatase